MNALGFASAPAISQYLKIAQARGLDWQAALTAAGIDAGVLAAGNHRFTGEQFQAFVLALVREARDPLLGLQSSAYVQPGSYNVLGYIVMNCATLGEAVARIIPYEKLVGDMGITRIHAEPGGRTAIEWHCAYPNPLVRPHMIANVLASWVNFCRWLADIPNAAPKAVELEFSAAETLWPEEQTTDPGRGNPARVLIGVREAFASVFNCPVHFSRPRSALIIDDALLDIPLRQPDQTLRQTLESHASQQIASLAEPGQTLTIRTRNLIRRYLEKGITRQDSVAESLGMTARTLQRHLGEEGTSYQILLDEVRLEIARVSLSQTDEAVADIAQRLGYAEPRSFHRSFKQWTGLTPGDYRTLHRGGSRPPAS